MDDAAGKSGSADPREARIDELERQLAAATQRIKQLEAIIEELRRGGKRQAAPFSRGLPKLNPRKPGRKSGDDYGTPPAFRQMPSPALTDQMIDVPPPDACPHCGDTDATIESTDEQVQRDIEVRTIVRRFKIPVARCAGCGKRRHGRHPLQTSTATGCCASQVGPMARGAMAFMNKTLGLSLGKITRLFGSLWNLDLTAGGVNHAIQSLGRRCQDDFQAILTAIAGAKQVTCDETGWRVGGWGHWLHAAATADLCAYVIDPGRGKEATDRLIGPDFSGRLAHDGWAPYDRYFHASHQQCNTHLIRRCSEMIEAATPASAVFPRAIKALLQRGLSLRDERDTGQRSLRSARVQATKMGRRLRRLCKSRKRNCANERLAQFAYRHADEVFVYLRTMDADATNWRGEHAMRYAVVNRKVWGGNRTKNGAENQAILMSVLRTLHLRQIPPIQWVRKKLLLQNPPLLA
jgi:transposase